MSDEMRLNSLSPAPGAKRTQSVWVAVSVLETERRRVAVTKDSSLAQAAR